MRAFIYKAHPYEAGYIDQLLSRYEEKLTAVEALVEKLEERDEPRAASR